MIAFVTTLLNRTSKHLAASQAPWTCTIAVLISVFCSEVFCDTTTAAEPNGQPLPQQFTELVHPFLQTHCLSCHGKDKPEGKLVLSSFTNLANVTAGFRTWEIVLE